MKCDKVAITCIAIVIHFQTTDYIEAVENVTGKRVSLKCSKCKSIQVNTYLLNEDKITIIHISLILGQQ